MYKTYCGFFFLAVALAVVGFAGSASAEVILFSDNFNGANNAAADYGLNDDSGGTRHSAGGTAYAWGLHTLTLAGQAQVNSSSIGGLGTLSLRKSTSSYLYPGVVIQHDFATDLAAMTTGTANPGFTIRYDVDPECLGSSGTVHNVGAGCGLGVSSAIGSVDGSNRGYYYEPSTDFVSTMSDNGVFNAMKNNPTFGFLTNPLSPVFDSSVNPGGVTGFVKWYTVEIRVATSSFASGAAATASYWWGPQGTPSASLTQGKIASASMPGQTDGKSVAFNWDANGTCFIDFSSQDNATTPSAFDNVVITGWAVPEPSTFVLAGLGLVGLLAYGWRKRK